MGIKVTGIDDAVRRLRRIECVTPDALGDALYVEGELIMTESKSHWVPVDLGTLRRLGVFSVHASAAVNVSVELGYGGAASAYALIQHERTDFNHPGGGRAKYLEGPVKAAAGSIGRKIARRLARAWGR